MKVPKILKDWWARFELYSFWDKEGLEGNTIPLISFSLDWFVGEHRPAAYYEYNDTNRWRFLFVDLCISRRQTRMYFPFKKLPDYVPTGKAMLRTRRIGAINKDKRDEFLEMLNGSKKV